MSELGIFQRLSQRRTSSIRPPKQGDVFPSLFLLLASRASVLGMFPFAVAMFAATYDKTAAYLGVLTLSIGLLTAGAGITAVKYAAAALLYWLYTRLDFPQKGLSGSVACGICVLLGGCMMMVYNYAGPYDIMLLMIEGILSALMFIVFDKAQSLTQNWKQRTQASQEELVSLALCLGVLITGFSGLHLPYGIELSNIFAVYVIMCIALHSSLAVAGSGGLAIGLICSMQDPNAIVLMGLYGLSALFGNLLRSFGKLGVGLGFLGGATVALLYAGNAFSLPLNIFEVTIGVMAFIVTPQKAHQAIGSFFSKKLAMEQVRVDIRLKEYLTMQLQRVSRSFSKLEESFSAVSDRRLRLYQKDVSILFEEVAQRVCEGCSMAQKCWQSDFAATYRCMVLALDTMERNGICTMRSMPLTLRERCIRPELFVVEFNHVYELYKKNLIRTGEAVMGRDLVARQYHEIAHLMQSMAEEVEEGFSFLEETEEAIVEEFDKLGIPVREVSVVESGQGKLEVYLRVQLGVDATVIERTLSSLLDTPMQLEPGNGSGLLRFVSASRQDVEIAAKSYGKDGQEICGDSILHFKTESCKYYVLICDGMGNGAQALQESHMTAVLLKEFLEAGFGAQTAIQMMNSALALKLERESFSTIDLLGIDLMTGQAEFYKVGSSESYLYQDGQVETVFPQSLPAGMLPTVSVKGIGKKLSDGDIIVMMSDGINGPGSVRGEWIKKQMLREELSMEELTDTILEKAVRKQAENTDDMSIVAVRIIEE
jgi:stage II sporulation protein E